MHQYVNNPEIVDLVSAIKVKGLDKKHYSDIVDSNGNQYVDLVQEGGGMLGIALTGYTYILEKAGIRFFNLAGTSAGAINTMMIACTGKIGEPVSEIIIGILGEKDLYELVDGNACIKRLIQRYIDNRPFLKFFILLNSWNIWRTLKRKLGINPGDAFERWITEVLGSFNIHTMAGLNVHRSKVPLLFDRSENGAGIKRLPEIKIIAADITTKSKIVFPEMAGLYWYHPDLVNPAKFVRASMSIPFFFSPFIITNIPNAGLTEDRYSPRTETQWRRHTGYFGRIPEKVSFVDGGLLSNFPINAFHLRNKVPKKPTFGVKLSTWRGSYSNTAKLGGMINAMIGTMRQLHDYDFMLKNPDYNSLICYIDADVNYNWLDFNMPAQKQFELFALGAKKAFEFLERFDWEKYKTFRAESLQ